MTTPLPSTAEKPSIAPSEAILTSRDPMDIWVVLLAPKAMRRAIVPLLEALARSDVPTRVVTGMESPLGKELFIDSLEERQDPTVFVLCGFDLFSAKELSVFRDGFKATSRRCQRFLELEFMPDTAIEGLPRVMSMVDDMRSADSIRAFASSQSDLSFSEEASSSSSSTQHPAANSLGVSDLQSIERSAEIMLGAGLDPTPTAPPHFGRIALFALFGLLATALALTHAWRTERDELLETVHVPTRTVRPRMMVPHEPSESGKHEDRMAVDPSKIRVLGSLWIARKTPGERSHRASVAYCRGIWLGNHSDWRLATRTELEVLNRKKHRKLLPSGPIWSRTRGAGRTDASWYLPADRARLRTRTNKRRARALCVRASSAAKSSP